MTDVEIAYSIHTGKLQLGTWKRLTHYAIVFFLLFIPILFLFFHLKDHLFGTPRLIREGEIWFFIIPSVLALIFYIIQRNRLKFKTIKTHLTRTEIDAIIEKVANELEWVPHVTTKKAIIAKTHPGFMSGSWGEQITILFDENRILINSICDPERSSSVTSFGRNTRNVRRLIEEIRKAED
ncbi:MAG: hypothetical protein ACFHU9_03750 [Fluviicola sp.]